MLLRYENTINDMNDAIVRNNISLDHAGIVDPNAMSISNHEQLARPIQCRYPRRLPRNVTRSDPHRQDVVGQNTSQLVTVLGLQEIFDGSFG